MSIFLLHGSLSRPLGWRDLTHTSSGDGRSRSKCRCWWGLSVCDNCTCEVAFSNHCLTYIRTKETKWWHSHHSTIPPEDQHGWRALGQVSVGPEPCGCLASLVCDCIEYWLQMFTRNCLVSHWGSDGRGHLELNLIQDLAAAALYFEVLGLRKSKYRRV